MGADTMTGRLLQLQKRKGAIIKCTRVGFEGLELEYKPRWPREGAVTGDPQGWVLKDFPNSTKRFSGGDAYACY